MFIMVLLRVNPCWVLVLLGAGEVIRRNRGRILLVAAQDDMARSFKVFSAGLVRCTSSGHALHPILCLAADLACYKL